MQYQGVLKFFFEECERLVQTICLLLSVIIFSYVILLENEQNTQKPTNIVLDRNFLPSRESIENFNEVKQKKTLPKFIIIGVKVVLIKYIKNWYH
jgi:hypothetical protein